MQYNARDSILRVYTEITVRITPNGNKGQNELNRNKPLKLNQLDREFRNVYSTHFINFNEMTEAQLEYTAIQDPINNMLIVCYSSFMTQMAPFVTWKQSIGYNVDLVDYSTIGSSSALKTYVANYYNTNGLTYLLLVGDHAQVPASSTSAGYSDNNYGYIVGGDHYLDIFVGRFSAETTAHVTTQVDRTVYYEQNLSSSANWFRQAVGMASNEGAGGGHNGGESDAVHMNQMLSDLSGYSYTTYQNYQDGGSVSNLSNLVNAGKGIMLYTGHGSDTAWTCGWNFGITQVNALTNENMLPFIYSVACVIGNFTSQTCFCESWLRATNNGNPTGAIAHAGSTINQSWLPPMDAQDEMVDLLVSVSGPKRTFGGPFVNGMFKMIDLNGSGGEDMADTWTCFGDPSVQLRTPGTPDGPGTVGPTAPTANFTGNPTTVAPGNSVQFTDTSSGTPTSWSWSFPGGTPSSSTAQNPTVTYNSVGTYDVSLTVSNAQGNDSITKYDYITVEIPTITYCSSAGNNASYEYIGNVSVGDLNNSSGSAGYTDFTSLTANVTAGSSNSISLTPVFPSTVYTEYWKIWIDYNVDGDFTDAGEEVFSASGTSTVTGSFVPPTSAEGVTTRMRVSMKWNAAPTSCETFSYGEVEDYTVYISGSVVNPPVAAFTGTPTSVDEGNSVSFTDQSTNTPTSWSWSFEGGTPSTSTAQNPTITYNTAGTYNVSLTVSNAGGNDTETKIDYITVNVPTITYCTASSTNQNYEYIYRVQLGSIDNTSGASPYTDYTSISTNLTKGASATIYLTPGFVSSSYTEYWRVWIDYNKDGDFDDAGETVYSGTGSSTVSGSFTVSTSGITGTTRMRVAMRYGGYASTCGTFTYGEVEDYTVNLQ
jgi:PKD repeat protein